MKEVKQGVSIEQLTQGLPSGVRKFVKYIMRLKYSEKPDYAHLCDLLRGTLTKHGLKEGPPFAWSEMKQYLAHESNKPSTLNDFIWQLQQKVASGPAPRAPVIARESPNRNYKKQDSVVVLKGKGPADPMEDEAEEEKNGDDVKDEEDHPQPPPVAAKCVEIKTGPQVASPGPQNIDDVLHRSRERSKELSREHSGEILYAFPKRDPDVEAETVQHVDMARALSSPPPSTPILQVRSKDNTPDPLLLNEPPATGDNGMIEVSEDLLSPARTEEEADMSETDDGRAVPAAAKSEVNYQMDCDDTM